MAKDFGDGGVCVWTGAGLARKALRQNQIDEESICNRESGRKIKRRAVGNATHDSTDKRTESETEAECRADHAHCARALFRCGDIGDVSLRNGDVAAGDAGKNSRDEKER